MKKYVKNIPKLAKEYDYNKNKHINFKELTHGSTKKAWWKCEKDHEWEAIIKNRAIKKSNCPYCSGKKVCQDNSLATTFPKLCKEWDCKNNLLKPTQVTSCSRKKVWWVCPSRHKWEARIDHRVLSGSNCPYCSGHKVCKDNCVENSCHELLKEWSNKNKIKPTEVTCGSRKKILWKCVVCKSEWKAAVCERKRYSCPYCSGRKVNSSNCLNATHFHLTKEWNHHKNAISPSDITRGSDKKVWWKCKKGHEWQTSISSRCNKNSGCPYCANQKVNKENCLATTFPILANEWSSKNKIKPTEITSGSHKKAWWKCSICEWEWKANIYSRTGKGNACPRCNESKGEKLVSKILDLLKIRYKREYKIKELGNYRFDFALFKKYKRKPYAIIEYHGEQHYNPVRFSSNVSLARAKRNLHLCQTRDKIKKKYCIDNNIRYLEISYELRSDIKHLIENFV